MLWEVEMKVGSIPLHCLAPLRTLGGYSPQTGLPFSSLPNWRRVAEKALDPIMVLNVLFQFPFVPKAPANLARSIFFSLT